MESKVFDVSKMSEVPECLQRRFRILDDLIRGIDMSGGSQAESTDPGVRLMCEFWNILKDNPDCNLPEEVQKCFPSSSVSSSEDSTQPKPMFGPVFQCYMAKCPQHSDSGGTGGPPPPQPPPQPPPPPPPPPPQQPPPQYKPPTPAKPAPEQLPMMKVLNNLKTAASFDNQCEVKLKELCAAEKYLKSQIARLEEKEKEGVVLMKEADEMWLGMENSYKERIAESMERQQSLMKQLQDIDKSAAKWRKNRRELESQLGSLNKCQLEMVEKINQKTNDLKSINNEIAAYKKRVENTKKEAEALKIIMAHKKSAYDGRMANLEKEITNLEKMLKEDTKIKNNMEEKGRHSVAEARQDLQKICKTLLQRRLEEEDLKAEKNALIEEIDTLKETCNHCKDRCEKKQKAIADEIKKTEIDIANFALKCAKCSKCVDSRDVRTLCIDCPRCQEYRECLVKDGKDGKECYPDPTEECVCSKVKKIFLNNVFENMSTVLEKKVRTNPGKLLGGEILKCLKNSTNAKLNDRTRKMLQEFVLQTVKKNLNLTIVGGACKTRCELDADTYKQLMLCMKKVKPKPPPKATKGTNAKKEPCKHWGGTTECNCPKGPELCICTRKAPPAVKDPATCPPEPPKDPAEKIVCPYTNKPCGPDCGAHETFDLDRVGAEVVEFRPDACSTDVCSFGKNMRAAQCVLGPEPLKAPGPAYIVPDTLSYEDQFESGMLPAKPCSCRREQRVYPRQQMIEEVMGEYHDVKPIDKVAMVSKDQLSNISEERNTEDRIRSKSKYSRTNTFSNRASEDSSHAYNDDLVAVFRSPSDEDSDDGKQKYQNYQQVMFFECEHQDSEVFFKLPHDKNDDIAEKLLIDDCSKYLSAKSSKNVILSSSDIQIKNELKEYKTKRRVLRRKHRNRKKY